MRIFFTILINVLLISLATAQGSRHQRSTLHLIQGNAGANLREFNQLLEEKGISPLRRGYSTFGIGYQNRFNDFVLGFELYHNNGPQSTFRDYTIDYRTSRAYLNVGYAFTEEGRFHLIHYMSIGVGYLNFEMLEENRPESMAGFLADPERGFILRQNNIHKGTEKFGGLLTEIGFQVGYDIDLPVMEESIEVIAKFGYSFSPFENAWNRKGIAFDNAQSGPFLRLGAGISLPDYNYFYRDASLGVHVLYGLHFTRPTQLNEALGSAGYQQFQGRPSNLGLKILGENRGTLYGIDIYNLAYDGQANADRAHTLNSVRVYGNFGQKLYDHKSIEMGVLGGIGYGNLRYTSLKNQKPDFPLLFEEPNHDGYLRTWGFMAKPELYLAYAMPLSRRKSFDLIYSAHFGYEVPLGRYRLADLGMNKYVAGPYIQFGFGIRP